MSSYGHLCFYLLAIMGIVKVDISVTVFFLLFIDVFSGYGIIVYILWP